MTFDELFMTRRSIRKYKEQKLETEKLEAIINAAIWAPTAGNMQLLHYIVVQDDETLDKIKMFALGMPKSAPCAVVICADLAEAEAKGGAIIKKNVPVDAGFAAQNILLKAHDLGLGACPVKSYNEKSVGQILKLPKEVVPLMVVTLGYYEKLPKAPTRKRLAEVTHYGSWKGEENVNGQG